MKWFLSSETNSPFRFASAFCCFAIVVVLFELCSALIFSGFVLCLGLGWRVGRVEKAE
jgi:hypothetical protein